MANIKFETEDQVKKRKITSNTGKKTAEVKWAEARVMIMEEYIYHHETDGHVDRVIQGTKVPREGKSPFIKTYYTCSTITIYEQQTRGLNLKNLLL